MTEISNLMLCSTPLGDLLRKSGTLNSEANLSYSEHISHVDPLYGYISLMIIHYWTPNVTRAQLVRSTKDLRPARKNTHIRDRRQLALRMVWEVLIQHGQQACVHCSRDNTAFIHQQTLLVLFYLLYIALHCLVRFSSYALLLSFFVNY